MQIMNIEVDVMWSLAHEIFTVTIGMTHEFELAPDKRDAKNYADFVKTQKFNEGQYFVATYTNPDTNEETRVVGDFNRCINEMLKKLIVIKPVNLDPNEVW